PLHTRLVHACSSTPKTSNQRKRAMKRRDFLVSSALASAGLAMGPLSLEGMKELKDKLRRSGSAATRKILIAGGGFNTPFIKYMAQLTGKPRPKISYLPTASADR